MELPARVEILSVKVFAAIYNTHDIFLQQVEATLLFISLECVLNLF